MPRPLHRILDAAELLDQPPLSPTEIDHLASLCHSIMETRHDIVLVQSEAIVALEAIARSVAGPGIRALNVVTGPYGGGFGEWMRQAGASVTDVTFPFNEVAVTETVIAAIEQIRPDVVAIVHAEAATGGTNDVEPIFAAARRVGALTVLDAVASIGAEPVHTDEWDVDLVAIGGQKALAGPAGISAVAVSGRAWDRIDANPVAPRGSVLSLTDWRDGWLRTTHAAVPGLPNWLEGRALIAACEGIIDEGVPAVNQRHRDAREAVCRAATELGLDLWQREARGLAPIATAIAIPEGSAGERLSALNTGLITQGVGELRGKLIRVNHFGMAAIPDMVEAAVAQLTAAVG